MHSVKQVLTAKNKFLYYFISLFILLQPIFDILTSLGTRSAQSITFGVIVRTLFMIAAFIFTLFFYSGKYKKVFLIYLTVITVYCLIFLILAYFNGGVSNMAGNLKELIKTFYFSYLLIGLFALYEGYNIQVSNSTLSYTVMIYMAVIFLAFVTGTSFNAYQFGKGYNGWFYAANEISSIISVLSPIAILFFSEKLMQHKDKKYPLSYLGYIPAIVGLLLVAFCSVFIGTKSVCLGIMAYLGCTFIWNLISWLVSKQTSMRNQALFAVLLCLVICILYNFSPLKQNMQGTMQYQYQQQIQNYHISSENSSTVSAPGELQPEQGDSKDITLTKQETAPNKLYKITNWLLSNRLEMLKPVSASFLSNGVSAQLFGIGYKNTSQNSLNIEKPIEMDFVSIFFRHGYIGLLIFILPIIFLLWIIIKQIISNFIQCMHSLQYCTFLYSLFLGLGIAFFAGHTLVAPAVSVYIAIMFIRICNFFSDQRSESP